MEELLHRAGFGRAHAYRYNSAVIRLRVIDARFEGLPLEKRDAMVESVLEQLPHETQGDIMQLITLAPSEIQLEVSKRDRKALRQYLLNMEFDVPDSSFL